MNISAKDAAEATKIFEMHLLHTVQLCRGGQTMPNCQTVSEYESKYPLGDLP